MKKLTLLIVCFLFSSMLFAQPIRELVFFGDSLSDNGNLYNKIKVLPKSPPYYNGRFSNGPIWAEQLAANLQKKYGILAQNYSLGGATVVPRGIIGALQLYFKQEVKNYLSSQSPIDKAAVLYVIWLGANDYLDETKQSPDLLVKDVMNELVSQIRVLIEKGGKNFIILDLPDLSVPPYAKTISIEQKDRLKLLSQLHHQKLPDVIQLLRKSYPAFHFEYVDEYALFNDIFINIQDYNLKYHKHVVNLTDSCWTGGYTMKNDTPVSLAVAKQVGEAQSLGAVPCKNPDDYFFWDAVHPTAVVHELFGDIMTEIIEAKFNFK